MRKNAAERGVPVITCLWLIILAHACIGYVYSVSRYYEFKALGPDIGAFTQAMHGIITTGIPMSSLSLADMRQNWFGFHFSPVFYLLAPLYCLFPFPETLQAVQAVCCSFAAWPIFLTLRALHAPPRRAFLWTLAYLCNPFLLNAMLWDFHEASLAVPAFAFGLWAVAEKRWRTLLFCCAILLMTKEHYGMAVAGFGLLWGIRHHEWRRAIALAVFGLIFCALIIGVIMPWLRGSGGNVMLAAHPSMAIPRYQWLLSAEGWRTTLPALLPEWIIYGALLLLPFCFLPLAAMAWLLPAAADLAANALSQIGLGRYIFSYHSATIAVVLAVAAYIGSLRVSQWRYLKNAEGRLAAYALLLSVFCGWLFAPLPLPLAKNPWELSVPHLHMEAANARAIAEIKTLLPAAQILSAQCNIAPFFSDREQLYIFPATRQPADAVVLYLADPFGGNAMGMLSPYCVFPGVYKESLGQLLHAPDWGIVYWRDPWLVMARGAPDKIPARGDVLAAYRQLTSLKPFAESRP